MAVSPDLVKLSPNMTEQTVVAVFGSGNVGKQLAKSLIAPQGDKSSPYRVIVGTRRPAEVEEDFCKGLRTQYSIPAENLTAATSADAAEQASVIILALPFGVTASVLEGVKDRIGNSNKVFLDITNPLFPCAPGGGSIPEGFSSGVEYHKEKIMEGQHQWGAFLRTILYFMQRPGVGVRTKMCGDPEALKAMTGICEWFGMKPVNMGTLEEGAGRVELGNCCGGKCCPCSMCCFFITACLPCSNALCPTICWKYCFLGQYF